MKKLVLTLIVLIVISTLAYASVQAPAINVATNEPSQILSYKIINPPPITPNVGWNS